MLKNSGHSHHNRGVKDTAKAIRFKNTCKLLNSGHCHHDMVEGLRDISLHQTVNLLLLLLQYLRSSLSAIPLTIKEKRYPLHLFGSHLNQHIDPAKLTHTHMSKAKLTLCQQNRPCWLSSTLQPTFHHKSWMTMRQSLALSFTLFLSLAWWLCIPQRLFWSQNSSFSKNTSPKLENLFTHPRIMYDSTHWANNTVKS